MSLVALVVRSSVYSSPPMLIFAERSVVIGQSSLFSRSSGIRRLVHFLIPVGDGVSSYSGITLGDLCLPGMLTITIHLIAAENGALDGRSAEGDAVALGSKVRGGDTELHTVQPVILVLAVGLLCTEAYSHRIAAVLTGRDHNAIRINGRAGQVGSNRCTDIVHAQGQSAVFELLYDFCRTIICVERSLGQFHGKIGIHCFCQLHWGRIGFVAILVLGDFGIIQFIKTDSSHDLFLHFIVFGYIHRIVVIACFGFITDVSAVGYGKISAQKRFYKGIFICHVVALDIKR
uniref:Uncharacterized protein n=1 Tax=Siphoviridae sp. ctneY2 TaxID=2825664 RepID=A0A8S5V794_9CAUD|nr:MAG TPA: hypothetical protein [Siphoviridae sp. ctneY2]